MPFAYLRDPLFLACLAAYFVQRILAHYELSPPLFCAYLNDVICIPFWVPMMLWALRKLRLREHDGPPQGYEIVVPLILWSAVFEVLLPATPLWSGVAVADPVDVLCYAVGALAAAGFWTWRYRARLVTQS